jgi:hypothetical protein
MFSSSSLLKLCPTDGLSGIRFEQDKAAPKPLFSQSAAAYPRRRQSGGDGVGR